MVAVKRIASIATGCAAFLCLFTIYTQVEISVGQTSERAKAIANSFHRADAYIKTYVRQNGHLPLPAELRKATGDEGDDVMIIDTKINDLASCCTEAIAALGRPPKGGYFLSVWRGEWMEYFAPWSGRSTLALTPDEASFSGRFYLDLLIGLFSLLALSTLTVWLWRAPVIASA